MRAASFTGPRFVGLVLASCLILFLRRPEALLAPQFFAEDGAVFFRDAYEWPFWRSLWRPHAGYPELFPRLVAGGVAALPLSLSPRVAPLLYALAALAVAGISLSWIWLPHFRHLIRSDAARLFLVLLLLLAPNQGALMKLSYSQWYLLVWATLASFMRLPEARAGRIAIVTGCALTFASSPVSLLLLPLWLARLRTGAARGDRITAAAVVGAALCVAMTLLVVPWGRSLLQGQSECYFLLPTVLLLLCVVAIGAAGVPGASTARRTLLAAGAAALLALQLPSFAMPSWTPHDLGWAQQAARIETLQRKATERRRGYRISIPINPEPWRILLRIEPRSSAHAPDRKGLSAREPC